jgi:gas vesicle protein
MTTNTTKTPIVDGIILWAQAIAAWAVLYALYTGKENSPKVKEWAMNMEQEIVEKIDKVKDITESVLTKIIDEVKEKYEHMKDIDTDELKKTVDTLREHWSSVIKAK